MLRSSRTIRLTLLQFALLASFLVLCGVSAKAKSLPEERVIENKIPAHLPLKIKMKNSLKVKDLKNEKWLRDLEVEVTNTGDKPIYHFLILVLMPEVVSPLGVPYGYPLEYGRPELRQLDKTATTEDIPLKPGESCTLKLPEQDIGGWEASKRDGKAFDPVKVHLLSTQISFGDGTGFSTTRGNPFPRKVGL